MIGTFERRDVDPLRRGRGEVMARDRFGEQKLRLRHLHRPRQLNAERSDPQEIRSINYTGILTQNMFVEGQYSERDYIIGIGS
ncbi:MAG: hypothetical protein HC804_14510, partial [Anaerolineae bacterium]|nr:hypothetical protein [Anaerolineae bacterium]